MTAFRSMRLVAVVGCLSVWGMAAAQDEPADEDAPADEAAPADETAPADEAAPDEVPTKTVTFVGNPLGLESLGARLERLWDRAQQASGRVDVLKDAVLEGGGLATASIVHLNQMSGQFRLTHLTYMIDGAQVFSQRDDGDELHGKKSIAILTGPISPGRHTITVMAQYRGHGYGPFKYLNKQTFIVRGTHVFDVTDGQSVVIEVLGYERKDVELEQRPSITFRAGKPK